MLASISIKKRRGVSQSGRKSLQRSRGPAFTKSANRATQSRSPEGRCLSTAYNNFFAVRKVADSDIHILRQAKAECSKLR